MKPKFFLTALLLTGLSIAAFAQKRTPGPTTTLRFSESISSLVVNDEMNIVLTESTLPEIVVEGNAKDVFARQNDGTLFLTGRVPHSLTNTKVYVPAGMLTKVYLNDAAVLSSEFTLSTHRLKIMLSAEAKIHVRSTGNVTVETSDDVQFVKGS